MKGWTIFAHSVRLVFSNLDAAFKVSLLPYALSALAFVFLGAGAIERVQEGSTVGVMAPDANALGGFLIYGLVAAIAALWIAVSWHRFVLLEEYPSSWFPQFHGGRIAAYFGRGLLIGLLIFAFMMVCMIVSTLFASLLGPQAIILSGFAAIIVATYLFYRLCPMLPSAAIGQPMTVGEAWRATANSSGAIAILVVLLMLPSLVVQLPNQIGGADSVVGIIYS
ncbi:MAG: hypothetical protein ACPGFC_11420, partial [Paracoccaceae bacterium]